MSARDQNTLFRSTARHVGSRRKLPVGLRKTAGRQCALVSVVRRVRGRLRKLLLFGQGAVYEHGVSIRLRCSLKLSASEANHRTKRVR
jgi:hypothetical protein